MGREVRNGTDGIPDRLPKQLFFIPPPCKSLNSRFCLPKASIIVSKLACEIPDYSTENSVTKDKWIFL